MEARGRQRREGEGEGQRREGGRERERDRGGKEGGEGETEEGGREGEKEECSSDVSTRAQSIASKFVKVLENQVYRCCSSCHLLRCPELPFTGRKKRRQIRL
eukprot:498160-Hanusia_phi.AAC.1